MGIIDLDYSAELHALQIASAAEDADTEEGKGSASGAT